LLEDEIPLELSLQTITVFQIPNSYGENKKSSSYYGGAFQLNNIFL
jgi:hypothetical protein